MKPRLYIGTYTEGPQHRPPKDFEPSRGVYSAWFDIETGSLDGLELAAEIVNPSFLVRHPSKEILYAVTEASVDGFLGGAINVLRIFGDRAELIDRVDSLGLAPCHLAIEPKGKFLVVSNYRGGNFVLFPLDPEGNLVPKPLAHAGAGRGPNEKRQESPHAHSAMIDPSDDSILMIDLGLDTIFLRRYDPENHTFQTDAEQTATDRPDLHVKPGSGCRHAVFSPDAKFLYVIGELDGSITVFVRKDTGFQAEPVQRCSTLPPERTGTTGAETSDRTASAIYLHPTGRTLYASNRSGGQAPGGVSVFSVAEETGRLEQIQYFETQCRVPRFCGGDPSGGFFFVCGQDNARIDVLRIDPDSGRLSETGHALNVDSPVCMLFES